MLKAALSTATALAASLTFLAVPAFAGPDDNSVTWAAEREVTAVDTYYDTSREAVVLAQHVYDGLVYWDQEEERFLPLLATEFRQIDPVTLEFDLREGVAFHDGSSFGPEDVVYTFNFIADEANGVLNYGDIRWLKNAEQVGERTVRLNMNEPFPAVLSYLALVLPIVSEGHFDAADAGSDGKKRFAAVPPNGTGPYRVTEFSAGDRVVMARNDAYFADGPKSAPPLDAITYRTINDASTQIAELMTSGIDWIWGISNDQAEALGQAPHLTSVNAPTMRISYLTFDIAGTSGTDVFTKPEVRRAVGHAIDRAQIARFLMGENSDVVNAACHPSQFGCTGDVTVYDHDPEKARALLAEAGYPDGFTVDLYGYRDRPVTEAIMNDLSKVGIRTNLNWMQYSATANLIREGKVPVANMTWGSSSIPDVSAITSYFFGGGPDDPANDAEVQASIHEGDLASDAETRRAAYAKALQRIADQAYWLPLFSYTKNYTFDARLDFSPSADEMPRFYKSSWK
ncbi:MAG: ABC transporter substrate-binding protein [Desulfomicrobium sp.]|uniref:ABC transporter substrate-binding protein n=1 Tax=Hoeflea sp. TaxID=1940281 RepID=UPI0025C15403|nr:ABC transporter substrate-binding protein [Hoeflea sp.]MBU4527150.1 ABC transporter substrate-binding protein [Alphaproteobacteria bacterium]MBV1713920.1 ABC transporter substrate-binding protein [Desulfomicrobium sp.]MBU4544132.1 ABC transporter substrate-binding protein [Alphaproteobacteria bacterium]MBU4552332.1 ABC transporter substrate-binding protein [Alphaproteobacteria bacterium]MBV1786207.1 ABC transporter substrate-binding protein [Hoeflea sp.]